MNTGTSSTGAAFARLAPRLLLCVMLGATATACGNRGPLYLPDEPPSSQTDPNGQEVTDQVPAGAGEAAEEAHDDAFGHEGETGDDTL